MSVYAGWTVHFVGTWIDAIHRPLHRGTGRRVSSVASVCAAGSAGATTAVAGGFTTACGEKRDDGGHADPSKNAEFHRSIVSGTRVHRKTRSASSPISWSRTRRAPRRGGLRGANRERKLVRVRSPPGTCGNARTFAAASRCAHGGIPKGSAASAASAQATAGSQNASRAMRLHPAIDLAVGLMALGVAVTVNLPQASARLDPSARTPHAHSHSRVAQVETPTLRARCPRPWTERSRRLQRYDGGCRESQGPVIRPHLRARRNSGLLRREALPP